MEYEETGGISEVDYESQETVSKIVDGKYVLFSLDVKIGPKTSGFRIFFNDYYHATGHGNSGQLTNSQLAEMFLDNGKWRNWRQAVIDPAMQRIKMQTENKINIFMSDEAKKLREEYRKHGTVYRQKLGIKNRRIRLSPEEAAIKGKMFKMVTVIARRAANGKKVRSNGEILYDEMTPEQKREYNEMRIQDWHKRIRKTSMEYEEAGNTVLMQMAGNPYMYGLFAKNILLHAARSARESATYFMLGAKAPDIESKTKRNRRWRGNPDRPPLNETGYLAHSIEYEVY